MQRINPILNTDSYKTSHYKMYDPKLQYLYSYLEARKNRLYDTNEVVFFGLNYFIQEYIKTPITKKDIDEAEYVINKHMGQNIFNRQGWEYILNKYYGYLPIQISSVDEGTVVPVGEVLMTIENIDPNCAWLTNYVETLLMNIWSPITVASIGRRQKQIIKNALMKTYPEMCDILLPSRLHDFGQRGVSSPETAALAGAAHLVNFTGTDNMLALSLCKDYYNADICGFSIPATEHSIMTHLGKDGEIEVCRQLLENFPNGYVACVSDSYDIAKCCKQYWGKELKETVMNRNCTLVVRPDSGDPVESVLSTLRMLGESFGTYENRRGYRVLNDKVRIIQGDGIDTSAIQNIYQEMLVNKWCATNICFGSGGGLLQKISRDTFGFAIKASAAYFSDKGWMEVYKEPVTDLSKKSKRGRFGLVATARGIKTVSINDVSDSKINNLLKIRYNGSPYMTPNKLIENPPSMEEIRRRVSIG